MGQVYIMDELLATEDVQLAVLGTGEEQYQDMFRYFTQKYPDKIQASTVSFRPPVSLTIGTVPYLKLINCDNPHGSNKDGIRKASQDA